VAHVLVAADKFKGSLSAAGVAAAVTRGLQAVRPGTDVYGVPVADGGEGTLEAALSAGFTEVRVEAAGPTGEPVATRYARQGDLAVVEMADVSGLHRLPGGRLAPMRATSRGTGEVIAAAIDDGCRRIVLGIGGSACTDGGAGILHALGARLEDAAGVRIGDGGAALADLVTVDLGPLRERIAGVQVTVACDVDNPLTGPRGAAAVYGPQKGADPGQVEQLDRHLARFADAVAKATGEDRRDLPGAGAAGGVGFATVAVLDARLRRGIDLVLDLVGFHRHLSGAALVVTGEGSLDEQTLHGKAPAGVAEAAVAAGVPVVAVCGRNLLEDQHVLDAGFAAVYPLTALEADTQRCIAEAAQLLERVGRQIATEHLSG